MQFESFHWLRPGFIRHISAVSNSIRLSAAEMRQLIQMSNFCRWIDTAVYVGQRKNVTKAK